MKFRLAMVAALTHPMTSPNVALKDKNLFLNLVVAHLLILEIPRNVVMTQTPVTVALVTFPHVVMVSWTAMKSVMMEYF